MAAHTGARRLLGGVAIVGGAVGLFGSVSGRLPSIIAAMFYPSAVGAPTPSPKAEKKNKSPISTPGHPGTPLDGLAGIRDWIIPGSAGIRDWINAHTPSWFEIP
jgi:hypothetical protein